MPIYEYQCQDCGHELEKIQRMSDPVLVDCPACEQPRLKKLISAAAFRLKGSGWYETDFKQDKKRNLAGDDNHKPTADADKKPENQDNKAKPSDKTVQSDTKTKSKPVSGQAQKKPAKDT